MKRSFSRFLVNTVKLVFSFYDAMSKEPLLDIRNPCYSSTESASSFLKNLSGSFAGRPASHEQYLLSFSARLVYPSTGIVEDVLASSGFLLSSHSFSQKFLNAGAPSDDAFLPFSPTIGLRRSMPLPNVPAKRPASLLNNNGDSRPHSSLVLGLSLGKRKYASLGVSSQSSNLTDLCRSSKRICSSLTLDQSSFEVVKDVASHVSPSNHVDSSALVGGLSLSSGIT